MPRDGDGIDIIPQTLLNFFPTLQLTKTIIQSAGALRPVVLLLP